MKTKIAVALVLTCALLAGTLALLHRTAQPEAPQAISNSTSASESAAGTEAPQAKPEHSGGRTRNTPAAPKAESAPERRSSAPAAAGTNKLERLAQTRESFRTLATG